MLYLLHEWMDDYYYFVTVIFGWHFALLSKHPNIFIYTTFKVTSMINLEQDQ